MLSHGERQGARWNAEERLQVCIIDTVIGAVELLQHTRGGYRTLSGRHDAPFSNSTVHRGIMTNENKVVHTPSVKMMGYCVVGHVYGGVGETFDDPLLVPGQLGSKPERSTACPLL